MRRKFVNIPIKVHKTVHAFLIDLQFILDGISSSVNNHNIGRNYQKHPSGLLIMWRWVWHFAPSAGGRLDVPQTTMEELCLQVLVPSLLGCCSSFRNVRVRRHTWLMVIGGDSWLALTCRQCNLGRWRATTRPLIPHMTFTKPQRARFSSADPFFQWKHILVQLTVLCLCSLTIVWRMRFYDGVLVMKLSFLKRYYYTVRLSFSWFFFFLKIRKSG